MEWTVVATCEPVEVTPQDGYRCYTMGPRAYYLDVRIPKRLYDFLLAILKRGLD